MTTHLDQAVEHLEQAQTAIARMAALRSGPHDRTQVAELYDVIGQEFKQADIEAQLAIAQSLADLSIQRLTPVEVRNLVADGDRLTGRRL